jgi:hypothetical protein
MKAKQQSEYEKICIYQSLSFLQTFDLHLHIKVVLVYNHLYFYIIYIYIDTFI